MIKCISGLATALFFTFPLLAQQDEAILFTVDDEPVTVGEFRYIYSKTNGEDATFSRESVMEYLDLYERFKLKVARAHTMGLDTVAALQTELEGYRKQLADNYLVDREVTDTLVRQLYERMQQNVDFRHLLIRIPGEDTLTAYQRAAELKAQLTPDNFATMAAEHSDDTYSKEEGGHIGFVAAPLPRGMHRLETALYDAPVGQVMGPVRTPAGYHLFVKEATRPAYGEVEIAHIIVRKPQEGGAAGAEEARKRAEQARQQLAEGTPFETVAQEYSEDDKTKNQGGYIGFFGINRYNKTFEEAAFALGEDGQISEVVESPVGYHILRRISRRRVQPLEEQRPLLEAAVKQDDRYTEAQQAMVERLKAQYGTQRMEQNLEQYTAGLDSSFFEVSQNFPAVDDASTLLTIGDRELTANDFGQYLMRNARLRASLVRRHDDPAGAAKELYDRWVDEQVEAYAEAQLENQFPEFKALMREYREGILLFEATKLEVWDKAGEDTTGLKAYFAEHRDDYTFGPRARVLKIEVRPDESITPEAVAAYALENGAEPTLEEFGRQTVSVTEELYEGDRLPEGLTMESGSQTVPAPDAATGTTVIYVVQEILPARRKELDEARGYVIADYQDQLERQWVEELRRQYDVKVNKKVLNKLIQS